MVAPDTFSDAQGERGLGELGAPNRRDPAGFLIASMVFGLLLIALTALAAYNVQGWWID